MCMRPTYDCLLQPVTEIQLFIVFVQQQLSYIYNVCICANKGTNATCTCTFFTGRTVANVFGS